MFVILIVVVCCVHRGGMWCWVVFIVVGCGVRWCGVFVSPDGDGECQGVRYASIRSGRRDRWYDAAPNYNPHTRYTLYTITQTSPVLYPQQQPVMVEP